MAGWRLAPALETLRKQVNEAYPNRSKVSDGTIGDTAHSARKSDHNPNSDGIVCAWDVTHDLDQKGDDFDAWKFAHALLKNQDPRLGYVISNGHIGSGPAGPQPGVWRTYTGANKHAHHTHVSVRQNAQAWNDTRMWQLDLPPGVVSAPKPPAVVVAGVTDAMRQRMAKTIIDYEARRDAKGNLAIHHPGDGSFEIAGANSTHHPDVANKLRRLLMAGEHAAVERAAADFILSMTKAATGWTTDAGCEFMLRDCVYNRGPKGGAMILQMALGVTPDGEIGQQTRATLARESPTALLSKLRAARERYEREVLKRNESDHRWKGMVNRWDKSLKDALAFQKEGQQPVGGAVAKQTTAGGIATGTLVAAGTAAKKPAEQGGGIDWGLFIPILVVGASIALVVWFIWPKSEGETG